MLDVIKETTMETPGSKITVSVGLPDKQIQCISIGITLTNCQLRRLVDDLLKLATHGLGEVMSCIVVAKIAPADTAGSVAAGSDAAGSDAAGSDAAGSDATEPVNSHGVDLSYRFTVGRADGSTYLVVVSITGCIIKRVASYTPGGARYYQFANITILYLCNLSELLCSLTRHPATVVYEPAVSATDSPALSATDAPAVSATGVPANMVEVANMLNDEIDAVKKLISERHYLNLDNCDLLAAKLEELFRLEEKYQFFGWSSELCRELTAASELPVGELPEHLLPIREAIQRLDAMVVRAAQTKDDGALIASSRLMLEYRSKGGRLPFELHLAQLKTAIDAICPV